MRLFAIDLHISVVADLKQIFTDLGHTVDDWCLSNHSWVLGKHKEKVPMLTQGDWRENFIQREPWEEFFNTYKEVLSEYDAFICCYPPAFSLLYKNFNKPIIIDFPIRYEYPFHANKEDWEWFNRYLQEGIDRGQIIPVANSMYDKKYVEAFIDREVSWIPSLCKYTGSSYKPSSNKFLYYSHMELLGLVPANVVWKNMELRQGYQWSDLAAYKGVVHFPYNISTMSIFEQYRANIPLFFPSKKFLIELYTLGYPVLDQLTWSGTFRLEGKSLVAYTAPFDPNDYKSPQAVGYWLQFADFYYSDALKYVNYFDSFIDLDALVNSIDLQAVSFQMSEHNKERDQAVRNSWNKILNQVGLK